MLVSTGPTVRKNYGRLKLTADLNSEGEKVMRNSAIRLVLMTMLIIGVNSATSKAQGPIPPQLPPAAVK